MFYSSIHCLDIYSSAVLYKLGLFVFHQPAAESLRGAITHWPILSLVINSGAVYIEIMVQCLKNNKLSTDLNRNVIKSNNICFKCSARELRPCNHAYCGIDMRGSWPVTAGVSRCG